ncbi:MAG: DUF2161 domain-containing phosphodiesterase [Planktomarina sp.]
MKETDLYQPIKAHLEAAGYEVKSEVAAADVVGMKADCDPVIVELKTAFSLALLHQAVARLALTDCVYVAVARPKSFKALTANIKLCRRLGVGVITVRPRDGFVEIHADPGPYAPRKSKRKQTALLREFARRKGDPNLGGAQTGQVVTAYRQDALACRAYLEQNGPSKGADVAKGASVPRATQIMRDNHYGWFERVGHGVYALI